jgi:hypothetical protein
MAGRRVDRRGGTPSRPRRGPAEVGIIGQFSGPLSGAGGEVAFGQGLESPGQAAQQPEAMVGLEFLGEEFGIAGS